MATIPVWFKNDDPELFEACEKPVIDLPVELYGQNIGVTSLNSLGQFVVLVPPSMYNPSGPPVKLSASYSWEGKDSENPVAIPPKLRLTKMIVAFVG